MKTSTCVVLLASLAISQQALADVPAQVKVVDDRDNPIKGATVYIVGPEGTPFHLITATTDVAGKASTNLTGGPGLYHFYANKPDHNTSGLGQFVVTPTTTNIQAHGPISGIPSQSFVEVHLFDANTSRPIVGLSAALSMITTASVPATTVRSDPHGQLLLNYSATDTRAYYHVTFSSPQYLPRSIDIRRDTSTPRSSKILVLSMSPDPNFRIQGNLRGVSGIRGGGSKPPIKPPVIPPFK